MITSQDKDIIIHLIKKCAGGASTDTLIGFVADNNGMLKACDLIITKNRDDDRESMNWLDNECHARKIDIRSFLYEVEQVLAIFKPNHHQEDHFAVLGLDFDADEDEIKQAYRRLSKKYHPDTNSDQDQARTDTFVRITKAYHSLLEQENEELKQPPVRPQHWRQQKKSGVSREKKRRTILLVALLSTVLIIISLIAANNYKKRVMLTGLQGNGYAFVPPTTEKIDPEPIYEPRQVATKENDAPNNIEKIVPTESEPTKITIEKPPTSNDYNESSVRKITVPVPEETAESENTTEKPAEVEPPPNIPETKVVTELQTSTEVQVKTIPEPEPQKSVEVELEQKPVSLAQENTPPAELEEEPADTPVQTTVEQETEQQLQQQQSVTQEKIDQFFAEYIEAYEQKNLLLFSSLFSLNAMENGEPLAEIMPTYDKLFKSTETIELSIDILEWPQNDNTINAHGKFIIKLNYKNGKTASGKGTIDFLLINLNGNLQVSELNYEFD